MSRATHLLAVVSLAALLSANGGCQSYYANRGALFGGLGGAGIGALVGHATGNTAAGAAIGAGVGAVTGAAVGGALDDIEAKNRAEIAAQLGRPVGPGAATADEVIAMTRAGVAPQLIANYVNTSGVAQPVSAQDVIYLHQQGVATEVIQAMQTPRVAQQAPVTVVTEEPTPIIVEEYPYGPYFYGRPHHFYRPYHPGPRVGWGFSVSN